MAGIIRSILITFSLFLFPILAQAQEATPLQAFETSFEFMNIPSHAYFYLFSGRDKRVDEQSYVKKTFTNPPKDKDIYLVLHYKLQETSYIVHLGTKEKICDASLISKSRFRPLSPTKEYDPGEDINIVLVSTWQDMVGCIASLTGVKKVDPDYQQFGAMSYTKHMDLLRMLSGNNYPKTAAVIDKSHTKK